MQQTSNAPLLFGSRPANNASGFDRWNMLRCKLQRCRPNNFFFLRGVTSNPAKKALNYPPRQKCGFSEVETFLGLHINFRK